MTVGIGPTTLANKWLDMLAATAFTAPVGSFAKLHTGDPGVGAGNVSSVTTRMALTWSVAAGGVKAITTTLPSWTSWAGTNGEVVSHISVWDAVTVGNFLYAFALTASKTVNTGDTLNLTSHSFTLTPIAA